MKTFIGALALLLACMIVAAQSNTNAPISVYQFYFGTNIYPTANGTNFWMDMNLTNGNPRFNTWIYQSILATNDVYFLGVTNATRWKLVSINVLASGGNRRVGIPSSLPHLTTNGTVQTGSYYVLSLIAGNEFRISCQTNGSTLSTIWSTFGQ